MHLKGLERLRLLFTVLCDVLVLAGLFSIANKVICRTLTLMYWALPKYLVE